MNTENQIIEWKETWRDEYIKWICGFANAQGGILIIGKNDRGELVGLNDAKLLSEEIPNKVRDLLGIMVDVNLLEETGRQYLEIIVEPYPYPINYKGQYHYRSGSTKQELKGNALNKFILQKTGKHWDSITLPNLQLQDLDNSAFELFRKKAARSKRVDEETLGESNEMLLHHLHLTENGQLKRAAGLLFHPDPEKFITGSYVKIGFFESESDLIYHDEIHGTLFHQADKTMELLLTKYLKAKVSYEGITRVETFPFPEAALREAVINAIVHKEYSSGIPIQIKVFENRIRIWNDGQLPTDWSLENLLASHPSKPNNPDVANAFFRAGMIESWGRGIEKIINLCVSSGIPGPIFNTAFGGLQIEFNPKPEDLENEGEKMRVKMTEKMTEKILKLITSNPEITIAILADQTGKSQSTINRNLKKLQKNKKIEHIGPDKGGYWKVIEL
ncbi:MAG: ATP-binding protein [Bacteroidota bacterium]|nr:ATP-binding protein [Bacteroidota bacterium]